MAFRSGTEMVLQLGTGTGPVTFATVAGINSSSLSLNHEAIDVTNIASGGWKEMLDGLGLRSCSLSGSGFANFDAQLTVLRGNWLAGTLTDFRILIGPGATPDLTLEGKFRISSLEIGGEMGAAISLSISMESSGEVTFTV